MSFHRFRKHPNIIKNLKINRPNQVWVSDITYIGKREKPCYLSLITDVYSKKIVGFEVSDTMCTNQVVKALFMAQKQRKQNNLSFIIPIEAYNIVLMTINIF